MSKYYINNIKSVSDLIDYCRILKNNDFCSKNSNFINKKILDLVGYKTGKNYNYDLIYLFLSKLSKNADIYTYDPQYLDVNNEEIYKQLIYEISKPEKNIKIINQKMEVISFLEYNGFKINTIKTSNLNLNKSSGNTPTKLIRAPAVSKLFSELNKALSKISESSSKNSVSLSKISESSSKNSKLSSLNDLSTLNKMSPKYSLNSDNSIYRRSTLNKLS